MSRFDSAEREIYRALADHILPGYEQLGAASAFDVHDSGLDEIANVRSDMVPDIKRGLRMAAGAPPEMAAARLKAEDPEAWASIRLSVLASYYAHDRVRTLLGYPGAVADMNYVQQDPHSTFLGIDQVIARGPIWRGVS